MIEITVDETRIRVEGHAGFGLPGRDIVCTGVSALFQTLVWSIEDVTGDIIEYGFREGNSFLKLEKCVSEECDLLRRFFLLVSMRSSKCIRISSGLYGSVRIKAMDWARK